MMEAILSRSGTVRVLTTSREGFRVHDERLWPVAPLEADTGLDSSPQGFSLTARRMWHPTFDSQAATPWRAEICQLLDGIPLAIELAASRLVSMSVTEVRDHINDRFRLLIGSRRGSNATRPCATRCSGPTTF